jgi:heat shock protein HspQ
VVDIEDSWLGITKCARKEECLKRDAPVSQNFMENDNHRFRLFLSELNLLQQPAEKTQRSFDAFG